MIRKARATVRLRLATWKSCMEASPTGIITTIIVVTGRTTATWWYLHPITVHLMSVHPIGLLEVTVREPIHRRDTNRHRISRVTIRVGQALILRAASPHSPRPNLCPDRKPGLSTTPIGEVELTVRAAVSPVEE